MRSRARVGLVLTGVVVCVAGACDAGEMMADAMVDAGELLRDASSDDAAAQLDAETPAPAPRVISAEAPCEPVEETRLEEDALSDGRDVEHRSTFWYAELTDDSVSPAVLVWATALGCDSEVFVEGGATEPRSGEACRTTPARVDEGVVRVLCGSRRQFRTETAEGSGSFAEWFDGTPGSPNAPAERFRSARIAVSVSE